MKRIIKFFPLIIILLMAGNLQMKAQKKGGHHHHPHKVHPHKHAKVVVRRSPYRPAKLVVFHPYWGPKRAIHRRWVFFPKYNIYWDNWRNHYVFWNGSVWFSQPSPPPVIVNINLDNEKQYELKENDDDTDDVYQGNEDHKKEYKPE